MPRWELEPKGSRSVEEALQLVEEIPVAQLREYLREEMRLHPNFVLVGETGSGKTTCLPPLLLELKEELKLPGKIAVTQPRKVATRSNTRRIAEMLGCEVGGRVGFQVRFENQTSSETDIVFLTDGLLLRQMAFDEFLSEYSIVMIDEAHERSTNIDLTISLLKVINQRRYEIGMEPIRIVITSATIEKARFADFIADSDRNNSIEIPGKMFPVEEFYEEEVGPDFEYMEAAAQKVKWIIDNNLPGDILIFMPGKKEINLTLMNIVDFVDVEDLILMPLHAELSPDQQDIIFKPSSQRKVIVSTNIAETSVTIDGVRHVIDSGYIKQTQFDPITGIEQLVLVEHALSGLEQRKGRAGRTNFGAVYRLFTRENMARRPKYQTSEILRSELGQLFLLLKKMGVEQPEYFEFLEHPGREALSQAADQLRLLGALDERGNLTDTGELMYVLGLKPRLARMIIEGLRQDMNCLDDLCTIAAFLDGKSVFVKPVEEAQEDLAEMAHRRFKHNKDSDFAVILEVWKAFVASGYSVDWAKENYLNEKVLAEVQNVREELYEIFTRENIPVFPNNLPINRDALGKSITAGLIGNLMEHHHRQSLRKVDGTKADINIHMNSIYSGAKIHESELFVADEIFVNPHGRASACNCLKIRPEWLEEVAPELSRDIAYGRFFKHHPKERYKNYQKHSHYGRK